MKSMFSNMFSSQACAAANACASASSYGFGKVISIVGIAVAAMHIFVFSLRLLGLISMIIGMIIGMIMGLLSSLPNNSFIIRPSLLYHTAFPRRFPYLL